MNIDYPRFVRICQRCAEIAGEPDVSRVVQRGYEERVRAEMEDFLGKNGALLRTEAAARKERGESASALGPLRSSASAHASAVSTASHGRKTHSPGIARKAARCSTG